MYVKMKRGIQSLVLSQSTEQHDPLMSGVFAFTGCPSGCDFKRCHACQHKAMIKQVRVVIGNIFEIKKKKKKMIGVT